MNPRLASVLSLATTLGMTMPAGMPQGPLPTKANRLHAKRVARLGRVDAGHDVDPDGLRDLRGLGWVVLYGCPPRPVVTEKGRSILEGRP